MNKNILAMIIGAVAVIAGAVTAVLILKKKCFCSCDDDFDEFEDFDMIGDDDFLDDDEFFGEDDYSEYEIGNDGSIPFVGGESSDEE